MEEIILQIKLLDPSKCIHGANFIAKYNRHEKLSIPQKDAFPKLLTAYKIFLDGNINLIGFEPDIIEKRTFLLNQYLDFIHDNGFDNIFSAQSKFRPTIMEEFMFFLFRDYIIYLKEKLHDSDNHLKLGGIKAYTNLYFSAKNLESFIEHPKIGIHQKDQDFAIYRTINIVVEETTNIQANLPVIAIENKTFIDKTMLEGSVATAEKIKSGNPYSLYVIVCETYEVDLAVDPAYSRINQIYVLRKCRRSSEELHPIYPDVVYDLFSFVMNHLERDWSNIAEKLKKHGKII